MPSNHRKKVKSYNEPGHAHELTFSCFQRQPFLTKERSCRWFIDALLLLATGRWL
jgi:putative transposase